MRSRWGLVGLVLVAGCGGSEAQASAVRAAPAQEQAPVSGPAAPDPTAPASEAKPQSSHLCGQRAQPAPCPNDVVRLGKFENVPACLVVVDAADDEADAKQLQRLLRDYADAVFSCVESDEEARSGRAISVRVLRQPGKRAGVSVVGSMAGPTTSCLVQALEALPWPASESRTSEVTLRLAVVTRQWVDDPDEPCPARTG